jgi:hypothetical protein
LLISLNFVSDKIRKLKETSIGFIAIRQGSPFAAQAMGLPESCEL